MDKKMLKEILAAHADQLVNNKATGEDYLKLLPEQDDELAHLLAVADHLRSTLQPITPTDSFEQNLKQELLSTAHKHRLEGYSPPNPARDLFIFLAALAFIISLGTVLIILKRRT